MKKKKKSEAKTGRKRYSAEFKQQALLRAVKDGVPAVARDLELEPAQLYGWRAKAQQSGQDQEAQRLLQSETARFKRELARLEEENAFLKKRREPPRLFRRLQLLRGWSHEEVIEVFPGSTGARGSVGA